MSQKCVGHATERVLTTLHDSEHWLATDWAALRAASCLASRDFCTWHSRACQPSLCGLGSNTHRLTTALLRINRWRPRLKRSTAGSQSGLQRAFAAMAACCHMLVRLGSWGSCLSTLCHSEQRWCRCQCCPLGGSAIFVQVSVQQPLLPAAARQTAFKVLHKRLQVCMHQLNAAGKHAFQDAKPRRCRLTCHCWRPEPSSCHLRSTTWT